MLGDATCSGIGIGILSYKQMMIYRFSVTSVKIKVIKRRSGALKWMCVARFAAKPTYHPTSYRDVHAETEISAQSRKRKALKHLVLDPGFLINPPITKQGKKRKGRGSPWGWEHTIHTSPAEGKG